MKKIIVVSLSLLILSGCTVIPGQKQLQVENNSQTGKLPLSQNNSNITLDDQKELPILSASTTTNNTVEPNKVEDKYLDVKYQSGIKYDLFLNNKKITSYEDSKTQVFPDKYTDVEGVITFRGNNLRTAPSFGTVKVSNNNLEKIWELKTSSSSWGGGAGWTGQPSIIKWSKEVKQIMNIKNKFKQKDNFTEVVYASLDGNVYFMDLETGEQTRSPIKINNPIKGSVALDPRGYPLLYVGQGIQEKSEFGYRIFSLIDGKLLYFIKGFDPLAYKTWGAFDGSPLINRITDTMILGGENSLVYNVKLNTNFDLKNKKISITPQVLKYRSNDQGIENSVAAYKNLIFFADNKGNTQGVDLKNMKPIWNLKGIDDTDATTTIEVENDIPYLYTGTEVDKQGSKGKAYLRKINGLTGQVIWEQSYEAMSQLGSHPVNGGLLATPVVGKHNTSDIVIYSIARYKKFGAGLMVALDKKTGKEKWRWEMPNYPWSSPVDVYDANGKTYIVQGDSVGNLHLLDGATGKVITKVSLGANIEASPAIFNNYIVIATRGGKMFGIKIK